MSQKVTAKNLSYNSSLPPFLAKLQAQAAGNPGPDPIIAGHRRGAKKRSASEDAEDVPLVVDEDGNVVGVNVDKDGTLKESELGTDEVAGEEGKKSTEAEKAKTTENEGKTAIGGRKRKAGRVVGGGDLDDPEVSNETQGKKSSHKDDGDESKPATSKKPKKKAKKIKLSFDEDEG